ncbi:unnamed protein product [Nezara viridula]|uniref:Uncharacterized protein n=1 Tax=Nezara viridula TaxID=85310 RepID=A0A9P0HFE6_NEZVI|nr:unnamed protein product [Nezara viridula]
MPRTLGRARSRIHSLPTFLPVRGLCTREVRAALRHRWLTQQSPLPRDHESYHFPANAGVAHHQPMLSNRAGKSIRHRDRC